MSLASLENTTSETRDAHPSVFELDTWFASRPEERPAETAAHLETCATCKDYVDALAADRPPAFRPPPSRVRQLYPAIAGALALAAAIALFVRARGRTDDPAYIGVKGVPAAQVLVRSDGRVRLWDGTSPVRAGDALAVRVACEQFAHVTVAALAAGNLTRAWEGACPASGEALPFTLVVDTTPGREHFDVVLSRDRLDDVRLGGAIARQRRSAEAWAIAFDFEKEEK